MKKYWNSGSALLAGCLLAGNVFAAGGSDVVVQVPGVEIRSDGSISAPGVVIGAGKIQAPGVTIDGDGVQAPGVNIQGGKLQAPGVSIGDDHISAPGVETGGGPDIENSGDLKVGNNQVVINSDNGQINTSANQQDFYLNGDNNSVQVSGSLVVMTVHGDNNRVRVRGEVDKIVVTGDQNHFDLPPGHTEIDDQGEGNEFTN